MCPAVIDLSFKHSFYQFTYISSEFMALDDLSPVSTASSPPSGLNVAKDRIRVAPQNRRKPARFRPAKANSSSTLLEDGTELDTSVSPLVSVKEDSDIKELEVDGSDHSPQDNVVNSKTESTPFDQACKADLEDVVLSTNEVQKSASAEVEHGPLLEGMQELLYQFSGDRRSQEKKIDTDENEVQLLATKNERDEALNEKCDKKLANLRPSPHRSTSESKVPVLKKIIDDTESKSVLERDEEHISPAERYPFKNRSQSHLEKEKSPSIDDFLLAEKSCLEAENEIKKENSTLTISNGNVSSKKEIKEIEHDSLSSPFDKLVSRSKLARSETNPTVEFGSRKTEPTDFRSKFALSNNTSVNKVFSKQFSLDNDDFRSVDVHSKPFIRSYSLSSDTVKENSAQDHLSKSKSLGFGLPKAEEKGSDKELVKSGEPDWITIAKERQRRNTIEEEEFLKSEAEDKVTNRKYF